MENKITYGIWFIFIGLILLLHNIDVIDFNFWATLTYWPLLIVIVGINLIVQNRSFGSYVKIGCNVLFLGWIFYIGMTAPKTDWAQKLFNNRTVTFDNGDDDEPLLNEVHAAIDSGITTSKLEFNGGAGSFELNVQEGADLVSAKSKDKNMGMTIASSKKEERQRVEINAKPTAKSKKPGIVSLNINPSTLWDLELNCGAATINGNLSNLRFQNLEINTGASTTDLTLGTPLEEISKIAIATGASTIRLRIPKDVAVQVEYSSVLSKNSFEGFEFNKDGVAETANYKQATKKFKIELEGAANTFSISRY